MASEKIRLGIIGANVHLGWAPRSHLPAIVASPEFELTAVCTTRRESAEESARLFGARLAFDDYRDLLAHPEIDAVAVVLRVPSHYEPTMAALQAGKHVSIPSGRWARPPLKPRKWPTWPGPRGCAIWWGCKPGPPPPSCT